MVLPAIKYPVKIVRKFIRKIKVNCRVRHRSWSDLLLNLLAQVLLIDFRVFYLKLPKLALMLLFFFEFILKSLLLSEFMGSF